MQSHTNTGGQIALPDLECVYVYVCGRERNRERVCVYERVRVCERVRVKR